MDGYEQRDNTGSIFKNDKKETDKHPDGKGSAMIGGVHYWISSWTKQDRNGNPYRSLSFQPKEQQPGARPAAKPSMAGGPRPPLDDDSDSIPF